MSPKATYDSSKYDLVKKDNKGGDSKDDGSALIVLIGIVAIFLLACLGPAMIATAFFYWYDDKLGAEFAEEQKDKITELAIASAGSMYIGGLWTAYNIFFEKEMHIKELETWTPEILGAVAGIIFIPVYFYKISSIRRDIVSKTLPERSEVARDISEAPPIRTEASPVNKKMDKPRKNYME